MLSGEIPGTFRLVAPSGTSVAHGSLTSNKTFVTNIPSLDFALRIWRVRWQAAFGTMAILASAAGLDIQLYGQLTENQTKTVIASTDASYLDQVEIHLLEKAVTAENAGIFANVPMEIIHDFSDRQTPLTVATSLNLVQTAFENTGVLTGATFQFLCTIEYTLVRLTADLRDYLAKRLQIQGS